MIKIGILRRVDESAGRSDCFPAEWAIRSREPTIFSPDRFETNNANEKWSVFSPKNGLAELTQIAVMRTTVAHFGTLLLYV